MTELVNTEVSKEDNSNPVQAVAEQPQVNSLATQAEENPQDRDWRKWRENRQKEREEAQRVDAARQKAEQEAQVLRQALEAVVNKPVSNRSSQYESSVYDNDVEESEEARIDRRVMEALNKKEKEYERQRQEREAVEYPQKLRSTFKDFEQVCTSENLDYLEFHHPELAKSLATRNQSFDKWADIYSAIKRYIPNPDSSRDAKKADKNLQKPQSLSHSVLNTGGSQMSSARLTEDRQKANWERMQRTLKGLS